MLRHTLFRSAFRAIHHSGVAAMMDGSWGGVGAIFCLHHVLPGGGQQKGFAPNSNLEISPEFLEQIILLAKNKGYDLVSIGEAARRLKERDLAKRFAVFTLDDGYLDNLVHAMPVFRRYNCPFTVYISPRIAEGTCELWWRGLELLIAKKDRLDLELGGFEFRASVATEREKWIAWRALAPKLQNMPEHDQRQWITKQAASANIDLYAYCRSVAMSWIQVIQMSREPLATLGAHTLNHYNLQKLPSLDAENEIVQSGRILAEKIGMPVKHFAYPYGNTDAAGQREFFLTRQSGYETSVVTRLGTLLPQHEAHLMALPRLMISGRYQDIRHINALMSGVPSRLMNRLSGINVA